MNSNPVGWFEIYVQDMERAKAFYEAVFGVRLERLNNDQLEMWAFPMEMDRMGCSGALAKMEGVPSGENSTLVYFNCEDCEAEAGRVSEAGGRLEREKTSIGEYGFMALAYDTEGNMIGLHSFK
jgi:predicted enzyme related to lactoylglutathione lyase